MIQFGTIYYQFYPDPCRWVEAPAPAKAENIDQEGNRVSMQEATEVIAWLKCDTATCTW